MIAAEADRQAVDDAQAVLAAADDLSSPFINAPI